MKNVHGLVPTRFMKRKGSRFAIYCDSKDGPNFNYDIHIANNCYKDSCYINNDGRHGYECHPEYKSSLFVNTNKPDNENLFTVLDYEVYSHNCSY